MIADVIEVPTDKATHRPIEPDGVIVHYTAGGQRPMHPRVKAWASNRKIESSTDFVVSRAPDVEKTIQLRPPGLPFGRYTWHAGGSVWWGFGEGVPDKLRVAKVRTKPQACINMLTVGLDADNYGFYEMHDGKPHYRRTQAQIDEGAQPVPYRGEVFTDAAGRAWEPYPEAQVFEMARIVRAVVLAIPTLQRRDWQTPAIINDRAVMTGHEHVKTTKSDPGPAFEWAWPVLYAAARGEDVRGRIEV